MSTPKAKPRSKARSKAKLEEKDTKARPMRHRVSHQITISPESTQILVEWVKVHGPGTKSMLIDMAIRHAERCGIFGADGFMSGNVAPAAARKSSIEEAIVEQLPSLIARLLDNAKQTGG